MSSLKSFLQAFSRRYSQKKFTIPNKNSITASPPAILSLGFLVLIILGTLLLKLPMATHKPIGWLSAAFTATSAVNVTGLNVVDTANYTTFGQVVIAGLIQVGGLGFMTFGVLVFFSLQGRLGLHSQMIAQEALGQTNMTQIFSTAKSVVKIALAVQLLGFLGLTLAFSRYMDWHQAVYAGFFYCVSAFNNAGFSLTGDSVMPYVKDAPINLILMSLITVGGLGFLVIMDMVKHRCWHRFHTNTKVMLAGTLAINVVAFVLYWLLERDNPQTIGDFDMTEQVVSVLFLTITTRTAGFNNIDFSYLTDASTLLTFLLMFIGAGSMSTAGGIKVGTFMIIMATTWAYLRQREQVILFGRAVPDHAIKKAFALMTVSAILIAVSVFILAVVEKQHNIVDILFEVISASGTVGLSRNFTPKLSETGQIVVMFLMYAGRLGPLTLAYFIAHPKPTRIKYPETHTLVG